jgi:radical SAM PhpK family P-methyltransferase
MDFSVYEKSLRNMGRDSGAYRDLNLNFIMYNNKPYSVSDIFNLFSDKTGTGVQAAPLNSQETFSAAIAYLGTYLDKEGLTFDYIPTFQEGKEELARNLRDKHILTVAIITTLYVSVLPILEIVAFIRKYDQSVKIVLGGPFISTAVRTQDEMGLTYLLQAINADFYINSSQGEATLVELIKALKNQRPIAEVPNLYYPFQGGFAATAISKENNTLAENMVNWELFSHKVQTFAALRTAISCPFSCAFCGFPEHAGKYQTADVHHIETELDQLARINPLKDLHIIDDTFNVPVQRFKEILRMMIRKRYPFKWHSYFRCQFADDEIVELMKESGCEGVFLGIESGSDQILKNMNKAATRKQYFDGIKRLKQNNITTFGNFIIGFPGETRSTVADTIHFIEESGLDFFRVQLWYCEPITPVWRQREHYGLKGASFEWQHNTMDSKTACDMIEEIFLSQEKVTWIPQFNFDFDGIWHLVHRGMNLQQIKQLLKSFNNGIKEKLNRSLQREVSSGVLKQIINACNYAGTDQDRLEMQPDETGKIEADFDF